MENVKKYADQVRMQNMCCYVEVSKNTVNISYTSEPYVCYMVS